MINSLIAFFALAAHLVSYNNYFCILILFFILFIHFYRSFSQFKTKLCESILLLAFCAGGLLGIVSISLVITIISAIILWDDKRLRQLLLTIIIIELPFISTIEGVLFNKLAFLNAGFLSPLLVIAFLLGLFSGFYLYFVKSLLVIFLTSLISQNINLSTDFLDLLLFIPFIYLFLSIPKTQEKNRYKFFYKDSFKVSLITIVFLAGLHSVIFYPKFNHIYYYYLPDIKNSYEAKFFSNYDEALSYTGKEFHRIQSLNEVPPGSIVLFPWITEDDDKINAKTIRKSAFSKNLTLILVGEHTNYSKNAQIINSITGSSSLNNDLTVPEFNTDESGHLRSSDFREWPANSIFNRGASVNLNILDLILLSGDHWWTEKNIGEWLWIGDFIRQSNDHFGRVPLGMSSVQQGARFVVYGDTSPFMNLQLIANPTAFNRLLDLAMCKFSFFKNLILLVAILVYFRRPKIKFLFFTILIIIFLIGYVLSNKNSSKWEDFYINQSGFNPNNFNKKITEYNELNNIHIVRSRYINLASIYKDRDSIHFGLIDEKLILKDATISNCRRMGLVDTSEFTLMDGQNCMLSGNVVPLEGSNTSSPAIKIYYHGYTKILIFDIGFLSEQAPEKNVNWLIKQYKN